MKKQGLLLVLSLLMLGVAGCSNEEPPASHSITLPNAVTGAHVYASTTSAIEGTTVTVTVVMTDSTYQLDAVKMGDTTLTGKTDENNDSVYIYNFKMPDGNAAISVETSKIVKDHAITLVDNEYTYVYGLPKEADVGDSITFGVRCLSGYELTHVSVKVGDEDVALTGDATQGYTFAMPDGNVTVETEALGAYFQITVDNDTEVTIDTLIETGIIKSVKDGVKILGNGELTKKLTVKANAFSEGAKAKIEAVGGTCEVI